MWPDNLKFRYIQIIAPFICLLSVGCSSDETSNIDSPIQFGNGISTIMCSLRDGNENILASLQSDSVKETTAVVDLSTRPDSTLAVLARHVANDHIWFTVEFFRPNGEHWSSGRVGWGRNLKAGVFLNDGNYYVIGIRSGTGIYSACIDEEGQVLWENTAASGMGELTQIVLASDGGLLVSGSVTTDIIPYSEGSLTKLDDQGNKIWEKNYFEQDCLVLKSINTFDDGRIAAWGDYGGSGMYLILSESGDVISHTRFSEEDCFMTPSSIMHLPDGDLIVSASLRPKDDWDSTYLWMTRINENGGIVWKRQRETLFSSWGSPACLNIIGPSIVVSGYDGKSGLVIEINSFIDSYNFSGNRTQNKIIRGLYMMGSSVGGNFVWFAWVRHS